MAVMALGSQVGLTHSLMKACCVVRKFLCIQGIELSTCHRPYYIYGQLERPNKLSHGPHWRLCQLWHWLCSEVDRSRAQCHHGLAIQHHQL